MILPQRIKSLPLTIYSTLGNSPLALRPSFCIFKMELKHLPHGFFWGCWNKIIDVVLIRLFKEMRVGLLQHWQFAAQMLRNVGYYGKGLQQQPCLLGSQGFRRRSRVTTSLATAAWPWAIQRFCVHLVFILLQIQDVIWFSRLWYGTPRDGSMSASWELRPFLFLASAGMYKATLLCPPSPVSTSRSRAGFT